jgi:hypothetical protein
MLPEASKIAITDSSWPECVALFRECFARLSRAILSLPTHFANSACQLMTFILVVLPVEHLIVPLELGCTAGIVVSLIPLRFALGLPSLRDQFLILCGFEIFEDLHLLSIFASSGDAQEFRVLAFVGIAILGRAGVFAGTEPAWLILNFDFDLDFLLGFEAGGFVCVARDGE